MVSALLSFGFLMACDFGLNPAGRAWPAGVRRKRMRVELPSAAPRVLMAIGRSGDVIRESLWEPSRVPGPPFWSVLGDGTKRDGLARAECLVVHGACP